MPSVQTVTETVPATTVFVSAGAPDTSGDSDDTSPTPFVSDGSPHDSDGSDVSSLISSVTVEPSVTDSVVKPFTTLTIDIWDNASEQNGDPEQTSSDTAPSSAMTDSSESSDKPSSDENGSTDDSGDGNAADSGSWTTDAGTDTSTPTAYGPTEDSQQSTDGASAATTQNGADTTNDASTWYTVVTDSDVYWTTGPSGPSQVTILLSHTLTVDGPAPTASETYDTDQQSPQSRTVIGSDGKPTIIVDPSSLPDADNGQVSQQHPACTKTITGADGRATIIIEPIDDGTGSGDAVPSGAPSLTITGLPDSSFPSGYLGGPDQPPQSDYVPFSGIYTTFTSFGADGLPTVIESALPFPRPAPVTQSGPLPTQPLSDGQSGLPGPGSASTISPFGPQDDLGITTSFTFTYFGANGPTAVESTVVIFPTSAASDASNTLPTFFPNTVGATDGIPGPASATTTCFSYTLIGADGLPTVLDSTVVLSPTNGGSNGYPVPIISAIPGASEGIPAPGGAPVTTAFSHTFVGTDGYPTVLATTLVITPPDGAPTPTFTNWPSNGVPTDFPPISGDEGARKGAPIATCTTFTYIGLDGNPTVTEYTYTTAEPVTAATALPGDITPPLGFPGSPTPGVPGFPGVPDNQPIITSTTFTYIGPDGNPTVTAYTYTTAGPVGAVTALPGGVTPPIGFPGSPTLGVPGLPDNAAITTCTTFTYIGADGKPTVTDYTWTASAPVTAATALPGNAVPGFSVPAFPTPGFPGNGDDSALTTGATYTVIGADGRPTITEASWIIPGPFATQTPLPFPQIPADGSNGLPSGIPGQITGSPGLPPSNGPENRGAATTVCTSYTILGADGNPTVIETTWTVPIVGPIPTPTSLGFPSAVPAITDLPQGIPTGNAVTTSYTAFSIGPDGVFTPVVQTIVYTPGAQSATAGLPLPSGVIDESSAAGVPALSQYGPESSETEAGFPAFPPGFTPIITDGRQLPVSGILPPLITGTVTATSTSTLTATSLPWPGFPDAPEGLPPSYGNANNGGPDDSGLGGLVQSSSGGSDGLPSELTLWPSSVVYGDSTGNPPGATTPCSTTTLRTSTWVNVIPEQTTTYTMNYPLTTLVALPTPALVPSMKRAVRRQELWVSPFPRFITASADCASSIEFSQLWSNSTMRAPAPFTPLPSSTFSPAPSSATPSSQPTLCSNGGNVGNYTLNVSFYARF